MPREIVQVVVIRPGIGKIRNGRGGHTEAPTETPIDGSPFYARLFRAGDSGGGWMREEGKPGDVTIEKRRVLRFMDAIAARAVQEGDIAIVPACEATGGQEMRATVLHLRLYSRSIQADLQTGDAKSNHVGGT